MNKFFFFFLFIIIGLIYLFEVDKTIAKNFNPFSSVKKIYIEVSSSITESIDKYFDQISKIEKLKDENEELRTYKLEYNAIKTNLNEITNKTETLKNYNNQVKLVKVLSYIDFNDFTKIWLDLEKKDNSILGLITDDFAAGIVVSQNGYAKALLNGNEKSNYAVFVGKDKAPGIIHVSKTKHHLVAKYIPISFDIKEGDEVVTSGMDNIFFEGLKVGKIISIKKMQDIQEATIIPYAQVLKQKSFFVYKKTNESKKIPSNQ